MCNRKQFACLVLNMITSVVTENKKTPRRWSPHKNIKMKVRREKNFSPWIESGCPGVRRSGGADPQEGGQSKAAACGTCSRTASQRRGVAGQGHLVCSPGGGTAHINAAHTTSKCTLLDTSEFIIFYVRSWPSAPNVCYSSLGLTGSESPWGVTDCPVALCTMKAMGNGHP